MNPKNPISNFAINDTTGCWEWQGYIDRNGYARVYDRSRPKGRRTDWAHRVSFEVHKGPIPDGFEIDHVCQNTICVNPDHLDAVSKPEHAARTMRRLGKDQLHEAAAVLRSLGMRYSEIADALHYAGRESAHEAVMAAVRKGLIDPNDVPKRNHLTDPEREDIRALYAIGVPQAEISAWYGVDSSHVSRICNQLDSRRARRERGQAA